MNTPNAVTESIKSSSTAIAGHRVDEVSVRNAAARLAHLADLQSIAEKASRHPELGALCAAGLERAKTERAQAESDLAMFKKGESPLSKAEAEMRQAEARQARALQVGPTLDEKAALSARDERELAHQALRVWQDRVAALRTSAKQFLQGNSGHQFTIAWMDAEHSADAMVERFLNTLSIDYGVNDIAKIVAQASGAHRELLPIACVEALAIFAKQAKAIAHEASLKGEPAKFTVEGLCDLFVNALRPKS